MIYGNTIPLRRKTIVFRNSQTALCNPNRKSFTLKYRRRNSDGIGGEINETLWLPEPRHAKARTLWERYFCQS